MRLEQMSDQQLVKSYIKGNENGLGELVNRHKDRVYTYVYIKVRSQALAEDIFQDTFIKVIKTLKSGRYNEEGKFLPWVMRIAHNLTIDHFRKEKKMQMVRSVRSGSDESDEYDVVANLRESAKNVDVEMAEAQIKSDVKKLIRKLPDDQREVLIMRHYYNMSFKEISEVTNVSINTALGRMRYALMNLRKMIEERNINLYV